MEQKRTRMGHKLIEGARRRKAQSATTPHTCSLPTLAAYASAAAAPCAAAVARRFSYLSRHGHAPVMHA